MCLGLSIVVAHAVNKRSSSCRQRFNPRVGFVQSVDKSLELSIVMGPGQFSNKILTSFLIRFRFFGFLFFVGSLAIN